MQQCGVSLLFHFLHIAVMAANLFAWTIPRLRRFHLIVVGCTLFSWCVLGLRYGFGYCFLTDWHWSVLESQGVRDLPGSYVKYLFDLITGWDSSPFWIDVATGVSFSIAILSSLYVNRDLFRFLRPPS